MSRHEHICSHALTHMPLDMDSDSDINTYHLALGTFVVRTIHPRKHGSPRQRKSQPSNCFLKGVKCAFKCPCRSLRRHTFIFVVNVWSLLYNILLIFFGFLHLLEKFRQHLIFGKEFLFIKKYWLSNFSLYKVERAHSTESYLRPWVNEKTKKCRKRHEYKCYCKVFFMTKQWKQWSANIDQREWKS